MTCIDVFSYQSLDLNIIHLPTNFFTSTPHFEAFRRHFYCVLVYCVKMSLRKVLIALSLLVYSFSVICEVKIIDNRDIKAFAEVTNKVLQNVRLDFKTATIITFTSDDNSKLFNDHIDGIIQLSKARIAFEVFTSRSFFTISRHECKGMCIFLLDKFTESYPFDILSHYNSFAGNFYVIHVHQTTSIDILENQYISTGSSVSPRLYYIVAPKNKDSIYIVAGDRFSPTACHKLEVNVVNRYSKQSLVWDGPIKPLTKANDFYGCMFKIPILGEDAYEGVDVRFNGSRKGVQLSGPMFEIFKRAGEHFNFEIKLFRPDDKEFKTPEKPDTIFFRTGYSYHMQKYIPIIRLELLFAIPPGELYSDWELLAFAFDTATWILIGVTFLTAFGVIFIINLTTQTVRDFVFGRRVATPTLNVLAAFYGLSQPVLPRRNFARFLLTLFIIWCLIIRTCYQGKLFEYLQGDQRKPEIQSIEEVFEKNLTFLYPEMYFSMTSASFFGDKK